MKWKYLTAQFPTTGLEVEVVAERRHAEMTLMGEYGWELVSTELYHNHDTGQDIIILFYKKPVADGPPGR